jgi:micrococcal nuclease
MNTYFLINRSLKIIPCFIIVLLSLANLSSAGQHQVIRVVDGDTIVVNYQGKTEKVRLLCVNTPESVHPDKKQNIPMGKYASDYAKKRLSGKSVDLEFEGNLRGKYGRLLAYVFIDGQNFNIELVRQGLSPYYNKYGLSQKYDQGFKEAERYAREHQLNIWGDAELSEKYLRLKSKWGQHRSTIESSAATVQNKEWKYVASKKSNVFHLPNCKWAQKIKPENLIGFASREEAVASGRRPCKTCMP